MGVSIEETFSELAESLGEGFFWFAVFVWTRVDVRGFCGELGEVVLVVFLPEREAGYKELFEVVVVEGLGWGDSGFGTRVQHTGQQLELCRGHLLLHLVCEVHQTLVILLHNLRVGPCKQILS